MLIPERESAAGVNACVSGAVTAPGPPDRPWPRFGMAVRHAAGQFFDPHGLELRLITRDVTGAVAQRLVDAGALVVVEECGCGAGPGGCTPWWLDDDQLRKLRGGAAPWVTGRNQAPTWIDQWGNDDHVVVFAHGEVCWGGVL